NHEESLRNQVAESQRPFLRRQAVRLDAAKVSWLERDLVDSVDFVTAITPEDLQLYLRRRGDKPMGVLTPGYRGRRVPERCISADLPRRAVIVGSYDWIAKRMNLEEFVDVADPLFAEQGVELQAVGSADERFLDRLRQKTMATGFTACRSAPSRPAATVSTGRAAAASCCLRSPPSDTASRGSLALRGLDLALKLAQFVPNLRPCQQGQARRGEADGSRGRECAP